MYSTSVSTSCADMRAIDAEDARWISIAIMIYEKNVWSVIFFEKFLSLLSLSLSASRDLDDAWVCDICGCDNWSCCCDNGCNDGDECSDKCGGCCNSDEL
jgi:hypothetical protein